MLPSRLAVLVCVTACASTWNHPTRTRLASSLGSVYSPSAIVYFQISAVRDSLRVSVDSGALLAEGDASAFGPELMANLRIRAFIATSDSSSIVSSPFGGVSRHPWTALSRSTWSNLAARLSYGERHRLDNMAFVLELPVPYEPRSQWLGFEIVGDAVVVTRGNGGGSSSRPLRELARGAVDVFTCDLRSLAGVDLAPRRYKAVREYAAHC